MTDRYRIALAQLNPVMGDIAGNLEKARAARAQVMDADVIAFSELFIVGYSPEDLVLKPALQDDARAAAEQLSHEVKILAVHAASPFIIRNANWERSLRGLMTSA